MPSRQYSASITWSPTPSGKTICTVHPSATQAAAGAALRTVQVRYCQAFLKVCHACKFIACASHNPDLRMTACLLACLAASNAHCAHLCVAHKPVSPLPERLACRGKGMLCGQGHQQMAWHVRWLSVSCATPVEWPAGMRPCASNIWSKSRTNKTLDSAPFLRSWQWEPWPCASTTTKSSLVSLALITGDCTTTDMVYGALTDFLISSLPLQRAKTQDCFHAVTESFSSCGTTP